MPLHALASVNSTHHLPEEDFAFDPRLPAPDQTLLRRLLDDLYRLRLMPKMASCCCFCAELLAILLNRNGVPATAMPCRVTIRTEDGIAFLGPGFAHPGQIDCHFAVTTGAMLIDWGLGGARTFPALNLLPLGMAAFRDTTAAGFTLTSGGRTFTLLWDEITPPAEVTRLRAAEKLKAARILNQASHYSRRF